MSTILHIVGARPQFVKAAPVSRVLAQEGLREVLVHTGQHYDWEMSAAFFSGLELPEPQHNLGVGSASHGAQTGRMLEALEAVMMAEEPDLALVHGDTNSTLAGALAAVKLHIPVAHVEAGLRSHNRKMPEEINRIVTDHVSTLLFAPTERAIENLTTEGITEGVVRTGDVMYDLVLQMEPAILGASAEALSAFGVCPGEYAVVTCHRPENTDDSGRWNALVEGLSELAEASVPVIWLVHPRTRRLVGNLATQGLRIVDPQPYLTTQILIRNARVVVTDSGGLQKEAAFHGTPCVTFRTETEWVELVEAGVNVVCTPGIGRLADLALGTLWPASGLPDNLYGDGSTSVEIVRILRQFLEAR